LALLLTFTQVGRRAAIFSDILAFHNAQPNDDY
jgi:hypothetical protein